MSLLVMKFGGTSVGSADAIGQVAAITRSQRARCDRVSIVVSAMCGVTYLLIGGARAGRLTPSGRAPTASPVRSRTRGRGSRLP